MKFKASLLIFLFVPSKGQGVEKRKSRPNELQKIEGKPPRCDDLVQDIGIDTNLQNSSNCICEKYNLLWRDDGLCYQEFTQGPCKQGFRFVWDPNTRSAICSCPVFWARHSDGLCYQEYTQGPCPTGTVIIKNDTTEEGFCGCNSTLLMYYHPDTRGCYELYSQGPCPLGHILTFNFTTLQPECKCQSDHHHHPPDGACYQLNTPGPCEGMDHCQSGTPCFIRSEDTLQTGCRCLPKNSLTSSGQCFQPYTRGPCRFGEWFVFYPGKEGRCEDKKYCKRFDNWHWWAPDQRCYRQFTQGPCKEGKLFYLDTDAGGSGCHCRKDWEAYYWSPLDKCYEQESQGPCKDGQYFAYNTTSRTTECNCFKSHVYSPSSESCVELHSQGPCPLGQVVVKDRGTGHLSCDCGQHLVTNWWPPSQSCYQLYGKGPCRDGEQFRLNPETQRPSCVVWGRQK